MKCKACYTENVNEAIYCKFCGRDIRETYVGNASKQSVMAIPTFLGFVLVVVACVIGVVTFSKLYEEKHLSEKFAAPTAHVISYYDKGKDSAYTYTPSDAGYTKVKLYKGSEYEVLAQNDECSLLSYDGKTCFVTSTLPVEISDCKDYMISERGAKLAYTKFDGSLHTISAGRSVSVDSNVVEYIVANDGSYVAYLRNDTVTVSGEAKDKNAFYVEKNEIAIERKTCKQMICANNLGFYYENSESKLIFVVVNKNNSKTGNTFVSSYGFKYIVAVGTNSVVYVADDGKTYIWNESDDETLLSNKSLHSILTPNGTSFIGDDYSGLIYTIDSDNDNNPDSAVYVDADGKCSAPLCENAKELFTSGDSTFLYYTDASDKLWRKDVTGALEPMNCAENASHIAISDDGRSVWYVSDDVLYKFDGMLSKRFAAIDDIECIYVTQYGYIVIDTAKSIFVCMDDSLSVYGHDVSNTKSHTRIYTNVPVPIVENKRKVLDTYCSRSCSYYIDKDGLHLAREDGTFKTDAEVAAESASDTTGSGK